MTAEVGWLDSNVILRFLLDDHPDHSSRARSLVAAAETGELALKVAPHIACEVVYILESQGYRAIEISSALHNFSLIGGIEFADRDVVFEALIDYRDSKVDFADALTAAFARKSGEKVWTFNVKRRAAQLQEAEP